MHSLKGPLAAVIAALVLVLSLSEAEDRSGEPPAFLGKELPERLHWQEPHSIRDLFVEDVPGSGSYWLGPWVETIAVDGIERFSGPMPPTHPGAWCCASGPPRLSSPRTTRSQ